MEFRKMVTYIVSNNNIKVKSAKLNKSCLPMQETGVWSLSQEDPLEEEMSTHSCILFFFFFFGKLHGQSSLAGYSPRGSQRFGHDQTHTHTHTHIVLHADKCSERKLMEHRFSNVGVIFRSRNQAFILEL